MVSKAIFENGIDHVIIMFGYLKSLIRESKRNIFHFFLDLKFENSKDKK